MDIWEKCGKVDRYTGGGGLINFMRGWMDFVYGIRNRGVGGWVSGWVN